MLQRFLLGFAIVACVISCNSHRAAGAIAESHSNQLEDTSPAKNANLSATLTIAPELLKKYHEACIGDTVSYDKKFISNFFEIIKRFNGRKLDTTILTTGNLDGDLVPDSIFTRVYFESDSIFADSKWVKDNQVRWEDKYTDPYTELKADLLDNSRNTWVMFAIGIVYGPPDFYPRNDAIDSSVISSVYDQGVEDLKGLGIHVNKDQYKAYLQNFKGDVITCGQPESRERLWIWYKPSGHMITYYQP